LILKDEVYQIVGAAMEVSNQLGCGFLEAVYQEALEIELVEHRSAHMPQKRIAISYNGRAMMICPVYELLLLGDERAGVADRRRRD
jgi:hypothetical protein